MLQQVSMDSGPPRRPPGRSQSSDSFSQMPAADREPIYQILKELKDGQQGLDGAFRTYQRQTMERLEKHDQDIQVLKENSVDTRSLALEIRQLNAQIDNMTTVFMKGQQDDIVTQRELAALKVKMAEQATDAGGEAGKEAGIKSGSRAGRKWGALGVVCAVITPIVLDRIQGCSAQYVDHPRPPAASQPAAK